jgi:hypothetical protein
MACRGAAGAQPNDPWSVLEGLSCPQDGALGGWLPR